MGAFTDKIRQIFNPKIGVTTAELKNIKTIQKLGHNAYFLRLSDRPTFYVHYIGKKKGKAGYKPVESVEGAAVWTWAEAFAFIRESRVENIEMVRVDEVLKTVNTDE